MWSWLTQNQNLAAVQAIAAAVQVLFAAMIWWVTRRYANLTAGLVEVSENQLRLQREALRASLYKKRLAVFRATMGFLAKFVVDVKAEIEDVHKLLRETSEAEFLFEPDAVAFIDQVRRKAQEHRMKSMLMEDPRQADRRQQLMAEVHALENWLMEDAFKLGKERFGRYLRFSDKDIDVMFGK